MPGLELLDGGLFCFNESKANAQLADPGLLQFYSDLENRTYWINQEIDENLYDLVSKIIEWNKKDYLIPVEDRQPIKLIISSPGGDLDVAQAVIDIIKISETPIWGIALGTVASAASMIYVACHMRFMLNSTTFVFHKGSASNVSGTYDEIHNFMENYTKVVEQLAALYKEYTNYDAALIDEKLKSDWYVRVEEALENGVADEVVSDIKIFF